MKKIITLTCLIILLLSLSERIDACWPVNPLDWYGDPNDVSWTSGSSGNPLPVSIPGSFSQAQNYIVTVTPYKAVSGGQLDNTNSCITIQYYDGLGRPIQTVQKGMGSQGQDLVTAVEYDNFGREWKNYLPTPVGGNNGAFVSNVTTLATSAYNDLNPYSETNYEASPLNRINKQYGPGAAWRVSGGHPVGINYMTNNTSDDYLKCIRYYMSGDNLAKSGFYDPNQLYVTETMDEDGNKSYEFKDKLGQVVLTRSIDKTQSGVSRLHDTYYVYDDFGNLRWVLPPMFESISNISDACAYFGYYYKYNDHNLCIEKKLPQASPVYYVYDRADRMVFSQDGEQRPTKDWTFYKYDAFGRMILTGVWKNSGKTQTDLIPQFKDALITESYLASGAYNYTWSTMSGVSSSMVLQVNYYDNYKFKSNSPFNNSNYNYTAPTGFENKRYGTDSDEIKSKGLLTGSISVMLDDPNTKICTVFYYDSKGRVIQSIASNHLGGYEKEYNNYFFTGNPAGKQTVHSASGKSNITETYAYGYDQANRPTTTKYKLNNEMPFTLSTLAYDDKGRLASKKQSESVATTTYNYNIRNWVTDINAQISTNNIVVFNEKIYYHEQYASNTPQYNGNISAVSWRHLVNGNVRGYTYTYDGLNRLKKGQYLSGITASNDFTEEVNLYDKNSNIKQMKRYALNTYTASSGILVDDLTLDYIGNQMMHMLDAIPASTTTIGFVMPSVAMNVDPVIYNNNGATKHNYYNGVAGITYNILNLPEKIRFMYGHSTQYCYDAAGMKRRVVHKTVKNNLNIQLATTNYTPNTSDIQSTLTTDYCAGGHIVYENGALKMILNPEGYVTKQTNGTFVYYYYAKDHLGNNRAVFTAIPAAFGGPQQEISYYPFGMPHQVVMAPRDGIYPELQPYKFGGKELDEMHGLNWYDQGARPFGSVIPRTPTMDPLAEKYYSVSPYAQCGNNPVRFIDEDGREIKQYNITRANQSGGRSMIQPGLSAKTEAAMRDFVKTSEGRAFLSQFAKAGDVVGGYKFTENGTLSEHTLNIYDFSYTDETSNVPVGVAAGSFSVKVDESGKATANLKVVSFGEDKASVGEIVTHETQLHGYKAADEIKGKTTTTESKDHRALKSQDKTHKGYQKYDSTRKQLEATDPAYKNAFKEAEEEAKRNY